MQHPQDGRKAVHRPESSATAQRKSHNQKPQRATKHHGAQSRAHGHAGVDSQAGDQIVELVTNAYSIITANRNSIVYEYDLFVKPSSSCTGLPAQVLSRSYVSRSIRQLIMRDLIASLAGVNAVNGSVIIEPNLDAIYSLMPLSATTSPLQQEFKFSNVVIATDLISHLRVDISIRFNKANTLNPANYSGPLLASIIHHQLMTRMLRYGSVYYMMTDSNSMASRLDLISNQLIGIAISGARKCDNNQTMVVINSSHSYITQDYRLIDLLASFLANRPVNSFEAHHDQLARITGNEDWFGHFCAILTGFKCRSTNFSGAAVNLRFKLSDEPASCLSMDGTLSVQDFYSRMGVNISYPNLPCLKSRSQEHPYHPLETCSLLPGQKVPIFRLSTAARLNLDSLNKPNPATSKATSVRARNEIASINWSQFDAFGVQLSQDPLRASGRTLSKPILQYKHQTIDPRRDFWESSTFYKSIELVDNWCVVDTVGFEGTMLMSFLKNFSEFSSKFGLKIGSPQRLVKSKQEILDERDSIESLIKFCNSITKKSLRFILFVIDSTSTQLNRMIHLAFDEHPSLSTTCIRSESVLNERQQRSIFRSLVHKLNARLGGTNHTYHSATWNRLNLNARDMMIVGLDVTHPDNELNGVSIVGCAYTFSTDLFKHKSLVWPQAARKEIITKMDTLTERLLNEYKSENAGRLPEQIIVYRDGVSNEEFERVRLLEIAKAQRVIEQASIGSGGKKPILSYIIAQKRHTMRFFQQSSEGVRNPPGGTLIDEGIVARNDTEFYLFSNTSPQATARPLHYHVILNGLGLENLQKLTYYLCFNFGKCSSSLSMPSSLRYAHNAAYDARNRVIASKEFSENKFYTTKFFC